VTKFSNNVLATSKFWAPEGWHRASYQGSTDISHQNAKFSSPGYLAPGLLN